MKTFLDLLDDFKHREHLDNDNQAAKRLGINRARLSNYRSHDRTPDTYACTRLALEMKVDPLALVAQVEADNAKNAEQRRFWKDFFQRARRSGLIVLALICGISWSGGPNSTVEASKYLTKNDIIRNRRFFRRLAECI